MAIQLVGVTSGGGTGATYTVSLSGTLTGGLASSPAQGDVVFVFTGFGNAASVAPTCSGNITGGYTGAHAALHGNDTWDTEFRSFYAVQGATPDSTLTIGRVSNAAYGGATIVVVLRGVDTAVLDATTTTAAPNNANGSRGDAPAITPVTAGAWVIAAGAGTQGTGGSAFTVPSGMTSLGSVNSDGTTSDLGVWAAYFEWTSGAYDPAAVTGGATSTSSSWAAASLAIKPLVLAERSGSGDVLEAVDLVSSTGSPVASGSAPQLQASSIVTAAGAPSVSGPLSPLQAGQLQAATGSPVVAGSAALLQSNQTESYGSVSSSVSLYGARILVGATGSLSVLQAAGESSAAGSPESVGSAGLLALADIAAAVGGSGAAVKLHAARILPGVYGALGALEAVGLTSASGSPTTDGASGLQPFADLISASGAPSPTVSLHGARILAGVSGSASPDQVAAVVAALGSPVSLGTADLLALADIVSASGSQIPSISGSAALLQQQDLVLSAATVQDIVRLHGARVVSGLLGIDGAIAIQQAAAISQAAGSPVVSGAQQILQAADAALAAGTPSVSGSPQILQAAGLSQASGTPSVSGSSAALQALNLVLASGSVDAFATISGSAQILQAADSILATGTPASSGILAVIQASGTALAFGSPLVSGASAIQSYGDLVDALGVSFKTAGLLVSPELVKAHVDATGQTMFVDAVLGVYVSPERSASLDPGDTGAV